MACWLPAGRLALERKRRADRRQLVGMGPKPPCLLHTVVVLGLALVGRREAVTQGALLCWRKMCWLCWREARLELALASSMPTAVSWWAWTAVACWQVLCWWGVVMLAAVVVLMAMMGLWLLRRLVPGATARPSTNPNQATQPYPSHPTPHLVQCAAGGCSGSQGHAGAAAPHPHLDLFQGHREDGGACWCLLKSIHKLSKLPPAGHC